MRTDPRQQSGVCLHTKLCVFVVLLVWDGLKWDTPSGTRGGIKEAERTLGETSEADHRAACSSQEAQTGLEQLIQHLEEER